MKLYVVVIVEEIDGAGVITETCGVFNSKELALDACYRENCFIGPCELNTEMPREKHDWIGGWYPALEDEPEIKKG